VGAGQTLKTHPILKGSSLNVVLGAPLGIRILVVLWSSVVLGLVRWTSGAARAAMDTPRPPGVGTRTKYMVMPEASEEEWQKRLRGDWRGGSGNIKLYTLHNHG
jgi:hypothetical protein